MELSTNMNDEIVQKLDIQDYHSFVLPFFSTARKLEDGRITNDFNVKLNPTDKEGLIVKVSDDKFRILLGNEYEPYLYRGENQKFDYFKPSLQRFEINSPSYCLEWIKKELFIDTFKKTPYYERLCGLQVRQYYFDFDLEAIAQHYEFKTNYIDLTRNKDVAEFFAYTYFDKETQSYKPITRNYEPYLYRAKMADVIQYDKSIFQIIGFQGCFRPLKQQAMALDLKNGNKTIREDLFETIPLENSEQKAKEIFDKFEGGKLLFPDETILQLKNIIDNDLIIPEQFITKYSQTFNVPRHKVKSLLHNNFDIKIRDKYLQLNPDLLSYMYKEFDEKIKTWIDTKTGYRLMVRI